MSGHSVAVAPRAPTAGAGPPASGAEMARPRSRCFVALITKLTCLPGLRESLVSYRQRGLMIRLTGVVVFDSDP